MPFHTQIYTQHNRKISAFVRQSEQDQIQAERKRTILVRRRWLLQVVGASGDPCQQSGGKHGYVGL